jgi:hypothetical protein
MIHDLRFAVRMLFKGPGFFVVAFLAIALGLGVNTTMFGIVNMLLLRPLPVGHAEELVQVYTTDSHFTGKSPNSYLNVLDYAKENTVFRGMAAYRFAIMGMTRGAARAGAGLIEPANHLVDRIVSCNQARWSSSARAL